MSRQGQYSLSIVRLAVDTLVLDEARGLPVEGQLTHTAPQAMRVPRTTVHLQQVLVCDWLGASCAHPMLRLRTTSVKLLPVHSQHTAR
jgi:hypothetical protein